MSVLVSAFLGLIQGITEFLPVSSSGHLSIFQNLFGLNYSEQEHLLFDVLLHLGTLAAVFVFYWTDIKSMAADTFGIIAGRGAQKGEEGRLKPSVRLVFLIIIATLPLAIILPFKDKVEQLYYNTPFISFALIITGILLYISGKLTEGRKNEKTSTLADAFIVGAAQMIAIIPGLSRSGTTITVALSRGYKRDFAVKFSFLMSIPAILGSVIVTFIDAIKNGIVWGNIPVYLVGMIVAAIVGYFALVLLRRIVIAKSFDKFAYYCWGAGIVSLILSMVL